MKTRLSICLKKLRFPDAETAVQAAAAMNPGLRSYRCDRCGAYHLTSRRKGKRIPRPS